VTEVTFVTVLGARGEVVRCCAEAVKRRARGSDEADVDRFDRTTELPGGILHEPPFRVPDSDRNIGAYRSGVRDSGIPIDPGRNINGDDRR
jgi:hypothetical protein